MIKEFLLHILPQQAANESTLKDYLSHEEGFDFSSITHVRVLRRSIDARHKTIYLNLKVRVYINEIPQDDEFVHTEYPDVSTSKQVIVVGAGPAGLFASLRLIELGLKPVLLERGKNVHDRKKDIALIPRTQRINSESNYCFGEGGAGAYSDGKLFTRSKKRGNTEKILNVFCQHGASTSILSDSHPHIGTDKLPCVIENMRNQILKSGGEVHFQTKMTHFLLYNNMVKGVGTVNLQNGKEHEFLGPVIMATGHSARDIYRYLDLEHITIEAKGIAVGVRLEHPSALIDSIQYHSREGRGDYLPAAEYSFTTQVNGRGVYSFCMCPGGFIIPAATDDKQIVVNGMSPSNRGTRWSNAGMVVELHPDDIDGVEPHSPLAMMNFQEKLENECWKQGYRRQTAPAQRMNDFVQNKLSGSLPSTSYAPGLVSSPLHFWLPPMIIKRLQQGFRTFGRFSHGFLTNEATVIAIETRTSSPVRILRNADTLQHVKLKGLFPCGEGAGYAGGIVSAAIDGERCAEKMAAFIESCDALGLNYQ